MTSMIRSATILFLFLAFCTSLTAQVLDDGPVTNEGLSDFQPFHPKGATDLNPVIVDCISEVSADTIEATLRHLQDFGSRFCLQDNRKEISEWIAGKLCKLGGLFY